MTAFVSRASRKAAAILLAAVLGAGLSAAGCGSTKKGSSSTATPPAPTKAQFIAQGNAICTEGNQKQKAIQKSIEKLVGNQVPSEAQLVAFVKSSYAPLIQTQIDGVKALGAPPGDEARVANFLALAQNDLDRIERDPKIVLKETHPFADFARDAHAYGLTACAEGA